MPLPFRGLRPAYVSASITDMATHGSEPPRSAAKLVVCTVVLERGRAWTEGGRVRACELVNVRVCDARTCECERVNVL